MNMEMTVSVKMSRNVTSQSASNILWEIIDIPNTLKYVLNVKNLVVMIKGTSAIYSVSPKEIISANQQKIRDMTYVFLLPFLF